MGKRVKVCGKCFREACGGNCKSPKQLAAENSKDLAAKAAARMAAEAAQAAKDEANG